MPYEIRGTVTGNYATDIIVRAHDLVTGELLGSATISSGPYAVPVGSLVKECFISLVPDIGSEWLRGTYYSVDDLVHPTAPSTVYYYFKCIEPGISGNIEPEFSADPLARFDDKGCAWVRVEGYPPPYLIYPVTATLVT